MFRRRSILPTRRSGLALVEVLVTLVLVSLCFTLIYLLSQAQAKVLRQQQAKDRFLVDSDALVRLLREDLSTAFIVNPTAGSSLVDIGHLAHVSSPDSQAHPFNREPITTGIPVAADYRGKPLRSTYTLVSQDITRESVEIALPSPYPPVSSTGPFSNSVVMSGVSGATVSVNGSSVLLNLSIVSEQRVHQLTRFLYAPGLAI